MKAISRLIVKDHWIRDKDLNTLEEENIRTRYLFGIKLFEKHYNADTDIVEVRKRTGYKND